MAKTTKTSRLNQIRLMLYGILLTTPVPAQFLQNFKTPTPVSESGNASP